MKKKSIISAILASCLAVSALGSISANAYYQCYSSRVTRNGRTGYIGTGVSSGAPVTVNSGYMNTSSGKVYASGNAYQKNTPWVDAYATSGHGAFTFYNSNNGVGNGYFFTLSY